MQNITMTYEQFSAVSRLLDFATWYIEEREPSGEQYFSDLEDICHGAKTLQELKQQTL